MKRNSRAVAVVTALLAMAGSAKAEVLLDLTNSPTQNDTPYALPFVATATTTTLSIAGYQVASGEYATDNGVFASGSSKNLLHKAWGFVPAAQGSGAEQYRDGTRVKALLFEGSDPGYYDTFSQTFTTVVGETYYVDFDFTQGGGASGFEVYTSAVPEPAPWAMMLTGLGGLGIVLRRRRMAPSAA
jgi:hypothetical protein